MKNLIQNLFGKNRRPSAIKDRTRFVPGVDTLEDRLLMAGDVAVALNGGVLTIDGDADNNGVEVIRVGNYTRVGGNTVYGYPTTINGSNSPRYYYTPQIRDIRINMRAGTDEVGLYGQDSRTGTSQYPEYLQINGNLTVNMGDGPDVVRIREINVGGRTDISTDRDYGYGKEYYGNDVVYSRSSYFRSDLNVTTGHNNDYIRFHAHYFDAFVPYPTVVYGTATINAGSGMNQYADTLDLTALYSLRDMYLFTGEGRDYVALNRVDAGGALHLRTYGGDDTVNAYQVFADTDLTILTYSNSTGIDRDVVNVNTAVAGDDVSISTGGSDDRVTLTNVHANDQLYVNLSSGNDTLNVSNSSAYWARLYGSSGYDSVTLANNNFSWLTLSQFELADVDD